MEVSCESKCHACEGEGERGFASLWCIGKFALRHEAYHALVLVWYILC